MTTWARFLRRGRQPSSGEAISLSFDGLRYPVELEQKVRLPPEAPRFVIASRLLAPSSREVLRVLLDALQRFTPEPHETWVVDNNSPRELTEWLRERPEVNLLRSFRDPIPPEARKDWRRSKTVFGSYSNAVALELGLQCLDALATHLMVFHMDTLPCREGWFTFLKSKLVGKTAAAGVRMEYHRNRDGVLHVLGLLVDYQIFRKHRLSFLPELPSYDVGDKVTTRLREEGYAMFACRNTHTDPALVDRLPPASPFRSLAVDRALDDEGNVIFMHLGRVVQKAMGRHAQGVAPQEWVAFADEHVLGRRAT